MKRLLILLISLSLAQISFSENKEHFITLPEKGDPILNAGFNLKIVSANGTHTIKTITLKTYNDDVYLCIDKKKSNPVINKVGSNMIDGVNSLMTPENKNYGQSTKTDTETIN